MLCSVWKKRRLEISINTWISERKLKTQHTQPSHVIRSYGFFFFFLSFFQITWSRAILEHITGTTMNTNTVIVPTEIRLKEKLMLLLSYDLWRGRIVLSLFAFRSDCLHVCILQTTFDLCRYRQHMWYTYFSDSALFRWHQCCDLDYLTPDIMCVMEFPKHYVLIMLCPTWQLKPWSAWSRKVS